jgi:hypothetical protein
MNLINSKMATAVAAVSMMLASLAPEAAYAQTACPIPQRNQPQANGRSNFLDPTNQVQANVAFNIVLNSVQDTDSNAATGFYRGAIRNFINERVNVNSGKVMSTITISSGNLRITKLRGNPRTFKGNFVGLGIGYDDINESGDFNNGGLRLDIAFDGIPVKLTLFVPSTAPNLINSLSASALRQFEVPGVVTGIGNSPQLFGTRGFPRSRAFSFTTQ